MWLPRRIEFFDLVYPLSSSFMAHRVHKRYYLILKIFNCNFLGIDVCFNLNTVILTNRKFHPIILKVQINGIYLLT